MNDPLFVDLYAGDQAHPAWPVLAADPRYVGAVVKATEGVLYGGGDWFREQWRGVAATELLRGAYHFLRFDLPAVAQADFYLRTVTNAGGWLPGRDLWPIVDVELGGAAHPNQRASAGQIVDVTTAWAERVRAETGRDILLYGNGAMRDRGITSRMGATWLWLPRYTATLPRFVVERIGWDLEHLVMWQHVGDGVGYLAGYPTTSPIGPVDQSVLTLPGGLLALRRLLADRSTP